MAESKGANKGQEKAKNAAAAGRMAHMRARTFTTEGFKSNEPVPSLSKARAMAGNNARAIAQQVPTSPRPSGPAIVGHGPGSASYGRLRATQTPIRGR